MLHAADDGPLLMDESSASRPRLHVMTDVTGVVNFFLLLGLVVFLVGLPSTVRRIATAVEAMAAQTKGPHDDPSVPR